MAAADGPAGGGTAQHGPLVLTADHSLTGVLVTVSVAALAFATRLNPLWLMPAGGCWG